MTYLFIKLLKNKFGVFKFLFILVASMLRLADAESHQQHHAFGRPALPARGPDAGGGVCFRKFAADQATIGWGYKYSEESRKLTAGSNTRWMSSTSSRR